MLTFFENVARRKNDSFAPNLHHVVTNFRDRRIVVALKKPRQQLIDVFVKTDEYDCEKDSFF
jgi:hypothetical protein